MKEHNKLLVELEIMAAAWWEFTKKGGDVPTEAITAVCVAYDTYQDKRVNDYRETVTKAKYNQLLEAMAQLVENDPDHTAGLDHFLTGYAGDDWQRAKGQPLDVYQIDFAIEPDPGSGNILSIRGNYEASDPTGAVIAALKDQPDVSNIEADYEAVYFVYRGYPLDIQYKDMPDLVEKLQDGRRVG
jgi:hypothetical protein